MIPQTIKESAALLGQYYTGARVYAVFDALQLQQALNIGPGAPDLQLIPLFEGTEDEPLSHAGPWLVDVSMSDGCAANIAKLDRLRPAVIWLISADDAPTLAAKLRERLSAKLPDGREILLRWWDPRAAAAMSRNLSHETHRALFGAALKWFVLQDGKHFYIKGDA